MVWIKFTRPYTVKNAEGRTYKEGELVEVSPESARHFIRRYAAVEVQPVQAAPEAAEAKPEEPPPVVPVRRRETAKSRKVGNES